MSFAAAEINIFGCCLRDMTAQFGLNNNPSVFNITVVQASGQRFTLPSLSHSGIRSPQRITVGEMSILGVVQAWDEQIVNLSGSGVFSLRMTDYRPALECVQVFFDAPTGVNFGDNVVAISPRNMDDRDYGYDWDEVRTRIEDGYFGYGDVLFRVDLSNVTANSRSWKELMPQPNGGLREETVTVPYRVAGATMSLTEVLNQVADDNGFEWYISARQLSGSEIPDSYTNVGVGTVHQYSNLVIKGGTEYIGPRGDPNNPSGYFYRINGKIVCVPNPLIGSINSGTSESGSSRTSSGSETTTTGRMKGGEVVIEIVVHVIRRRVEPLNMQGIVNQHTGAVIRRVEGHETRDEVTRTVIVGTQKQRLSRTATLKPFWGFDEDGTLLSQPKFLYTKDGKDQLLTTNVATLSKVINGNTSGMTSEFVEACRAYADEYWGRKFYADLLDASTDDNGDPWVEVCTAGWYENGTRRFDYRKGRWTSVLPASMPEAGRTMFGTTDGRYTSFVVLPTTTGVWSDSVRTSDSALFSGGSGWMKASVERIDTNPSRNDKDSIWLVTLPASLEATVQNPQGSGTVKARASSLGGAYVPVIDRRTMYGPWTSDTIIPESMRIKGKTRVIVDANLAPWTYGYRGMGAEDALLIMKQLAMARIRTYTHQLTEMATGELEVAELPKFNLGTAIGRGTNITNINVTWDIRGVRTLYKCNLFTNELGRYQRYYQELIDKLRREAERRQNALDTGPNYWSLNRELNNVRTDNKSKTGKDGASGETTQTAKVITRYTEHPWYDCVLLKDKIVNGRITTEEASVGVVSVTNLSEHPDAPARVPVGHIVTIHPARTSLVTTPQGNEVSAITAWTMRESTPEPGSLVCRVVRSLNPPAGNVGPPRYELEIVTGDLGPLIQEEIDLLANVLNLGEPYGSPGFVPLNSQVDVFWVEQNDHKYVPFFNLALNIFINPDV